MDPEMAMLLDELKQVAGKYIAIMRDVPGIEEYQAHMEQLETLPRQCDELRDIMQQRDRLHQSNLARAAAAELQAAQAAAATPAPLEAPPEPPLDEAGVLKAIRRLLDGLAPAASPKVATAGEVATMASAEWAAEPAEPPRPPVAAHAEPDIDETPALVIAALLQLARIEAGDVLYSLGCGDGRLLISAASKHGARGVGIDSKVAAVEAARENLRKTRLTRHVTIDAGNPLTTDVSSATAVFLALGAKQNSELGDSLLRQLRAGARIVTHQGGLPGWQPDEEQVVRDAEGKTYRLRLWRVRGRTAGPASSLGNLSESDWGSRTE